MGALLFFGILIWALTTAAIYFKGYHDGETAVCLKHKAYLEVNSTDKEKE